jgi:sterol desaturase/sphingolipid hydroxylase (fatty acid hydroxylase superfamily)
MKIEEIIPLAVPFAYLLLLVSETRLKGRDFPEVRGWRLKGLAFFAALLATSLALPIVLPVDWMKANSLLDISSIGVWSAPIALLLTTLFTYWFHRAEHRFDWMWRTFHQLHHSALRVDIAGAFYTHPLEPAAKMTLGMIVAFLVLGLDPITAAITSTLTGLLSMFQHWNITTPHWLGYIVPRPESHCLHHERGVHARNYGDLPVWDMLFGTYLNPREALIVDVGFGEAQAARLGTMLLMRDVEIGSTDGGGT